MKGLLSKAGKWFLDKNASTIVDGVEAVGKNKLNKKKVGLVALGVLAILRLCGAITEETLVSLFNELF